MRDRKDAGVSRAYLPMAQRDPFTPRDLGTSPRAGFGLIQFACVQITRLATLTTRGMLLAILFSGNAVLHSSASACTSAPTHVLRTRSSRIENPTRLCTFVRRARRGRQSGYTQKECWPLSLKLSRCV